MPGYTVTRLEEMDEISDGRSALRPVRHHLGITSFGVNAFTGREVGDRIVDEHDEADDGNEELYVVVRGRAVFELDGERVVATPGTLVFARPGVKRTAFAEAPGTTLLALGGTPGKAYVARGWEFWAPLRDLYERGEYAEAADRLGPVVEAHPEYPLLQYNLACCESLAGRTADAVEHLRRSIELSDEFREYARGEAPRPDSDVLPTGDLDAIRGVSGFGELVGR